MWSLSLSCAVGFKTYLFDSAVRVNYEMLKDECFNGLKNVVIQISYFAFKNTLLYSGWSVAAFSHQIFLNNYEWQRCKTDWFPY